jgi:acyl-coenzyme A thioesterase PaaI-like protein
MKEIERYPGCFVCGDKNEHGLQAKFYYDGEKAITRVTARVMFEGYKDIYHGGIQATLLDEVMVKAVMAQNVYAVTAEMTVKYQHPVTIGEELEFTGWVTKSRHGLFYTEGKLTGESGTVYATATAKYIQARDDLKDKLMSSRMS